MTTDRELRQYVEQRVQAANKILDQINPDSCVKENHESPRITALFEEIQKKLGK